MAAGTLSGRSLTRPSGAAGLGDRDRAAIDGVGALARREHPMHFLRRAEGHERPPAEGPRDLHRSHLCVRAVQGVSV